MMGGKVLRRLSVLRASPERLQRLVSGLQRLLSVHDHHSPTPPKTKVDGRPSRPAYSLRGEVVIISQVENIKPGLRTHTWTCKPVRPDLFA